MSKVKVLVVDDAVVIRKIISDVLGTDPDIEVVGTAPNGKIALSKIPLLKPDIVTLDVEMPEMDGLETLVHLRKEHPRLPVIMFSTLTERGASATIEALSRGASDYVSKPSNVGKESNTRDAVRDDLIRKIKALVPSSSPASKRVVPPLPSFAIKSTGTGVGLSNIGSHPIRFITIGVSTGGPNALAKVIPLLPEDLSVPVLIVQHMPPMFTRLLAERLDSQSKLKVIEAENGMQVSRGHVYIAPGNFHMALKGTVQSPIITLNQDALENSCRPAADVLFRSAVSLAKGEILGVVLTGMGQDGMIGCRLIKEAGGFVLAQDKETSVVWGMPGSVIEHGLADKILPLESIAGEISRVVRNSASISPQRGSAPIC